MEKIERTHAPPWLKEKSIEWGNEWAQKYKKNKKSVFRWRNNKKKGYKDLIKELSTITKAHCSYCDVQPMGRIPETIDHFRPKSIFPELAYEWSNLFLCCGNCQKRGEKFDEKLLKPDDTSYDFEKYFDIDWLTGEIIPNKSAKANDIQRALVTIKLFKLNKNGKPKDRIKELEHYEKLAKYYQDLNLVDFSYRFFIREAIL